MTTQIPETVGLTAKQAKVVQAIREGIANSEDEILSMDVKNGQYFASVFIRKASKSLSGNKNQFLIANSVQAFIEPNGHVSTVYYYPSIGPVAEIKGGLKYYYLKLNNASNFVHRKSGRHYIA